MLSVNDIKKIAQKMSLQQGYSSDVEISPFWFNSFGSKSVGISQFTNFYCYEPRLGTWSSSVGTDRSYVMYGNLTFGAYPSVVPTNNYEISLTLTNLLSFSQTLSSGTYVVKARGTNLNPFVTFINPTNYFDPILYQSTQPEFFARPCINVSTNGTGTLTYVPYVSFSGFMINFI